MSHELFALLGRDAKEVDGDPLLQKLGTFKKRKDEGRTYFVNRQAGLDYIVERKKVDTIFLFAEGQERHLQYQGSLPGGIHFSDGRTVAREKLGPPVRSAERSHSPLRGEMTAWDLFVLNEDLAVHVQYSSDEQSILLTTLQLAANVPGGI
ncbi:MAG: hypothetical protein AB7K24_09835 [Gemmataceae bacterium]